GVLDAVDARLVLLVAEHGTDGVLGEQQLDARSGVEEDRVLIDLLDRGVHAPDGADAGTGLHLVPHLDGLLLLLLGRPGHQEHGPDEHNEREEGQETHGSELPSHDRDGERPDGWGYVMPPTTVASAESKRVRAHGTTLSMAPG